MTRTAVWAMFFCCLGLWGCAKFQPIMTPQEFEAACRRGGGEAAWARTVCDVYQAVVTDYHDTMDDCYAACRDRGAALAADSATQCLDKVKATQAVCLDFCNRKFYRCNCAK